MPLVRVAGMMTIARQRGKSKAIASMQFNWRTSDVGGGRGSQAGRVSTAWVGAPYELSIRASPVRRPIVKNWCRVSLRS